MSKFPIGLVVVAVAIYTGSSLQAADQADPAPLGSEWTGVWRRANLRAEAGDKVGSSSVKLKFTMREENKFKAEVWLGGGRGLELEGTITKTGSDNFRGKISRILKGEFASAVVGRNALVGYVRNGSLKAKHESPTGTGLGELELTLEKRR